MIIKMRSKLENIWFVICIMFVGGFSSMGILFFVDNIFNTSNVLQTLLISIPFYIIVIIGYIKLMGLKNE